MVTCFARILSISALNSFCAACQRAGKAFRCVYRSFLRSSAVVSHASGDAEGSIQELPRVSSCFHSEPDMVCVAPVPTGARAAYRRITLNKAAADDEESLIRRGGVPARARASSGHRRASYRRRCTNCSRKHVGSSGNVCGFRLADSSLHTLYIALTLSRCVYYWDRILRARVCLGQWTLHAVVRAFSSPPSLALGGKRYCIESLGLCGGARLCLFGASLTKEPARLTVCSGAVFGCIAL